MERRREYSLHVSWPMATTDGRTNIRDGAHFFVESRGIFENTENSERMSNMETAKERRPGHFGNEYSDMLQDRKTCLCNLSAIHCRVHTERRAQHARWTSSNTHLYAKWLITFRVCLGNTLVCSAFTHRSTLASVQRQQRHQWQQQQHHSYRIFRSFMSSTKIFYCLEMDGI